jgi:Arc/MetJ-type ribon-helix-helix transcriptional regulator
MHDARQPPRTRRNRMDRRAIQRTVRLSPDIDEAVNRWMNTPEFRNNRSAIVDEALAEWLNRREDRKAA